MLVLNFLLISWVTAHCSSEQGSLIVAGFGEVRSYFESLARCGIQVWDQLVGRRAYGTWS